MIEMSLNRKKELSLIAKEFCRNLRLNQTNFEKSIWGIVRNRKLLGRKFLRQHPIFYDLLGKESFYISDFYCHELKLVIEIDGKIHDYNKENDKQRDLIMGLLGLNVLRFKNDEIEDSSSNVIKKIENSIIELDNKLTHPKSLS
jgi:very-short-patch-repair endonuclease